MTIERAFFFGVAVLAALAIGAPAVIADEQPAQAETPPLAPAWLEPLRDREGRISWRAIAIGMEMREIASLLRVQLRTDLVMEAGCGGDALELVVDGVRLLMGFGRHTRDAKLHTLFVYADPPLEPNTAVASLRHRLPGLTPAGLDDPRPAYRVGGPEVLLVIDPRGLWLSHPACLD